MTMEEERDEARRLAEQYLVMLCNERAKVANLRSALVAARGRIHDVYGFALAGRSVLNLYAQIDAALASSDPTNGAGGA